MKWIRLILAACVAAVMPTYSVSAAHSPPKWLKISELDANQNRVEDSIDGMAGTDTVDIVIGWCCDTIPQNRVMEIIEFGIHDFDGCTLAVSCFREVNVQYVLDEIAQMPEVAQVWQDRLIYPSSGVAGQALKAHSSALYSPNTAEDAGFNGQGVTVAIVDTGVDDDVHTDLPNAVGGISVDANGVVLGNPDDEVGHGTAVAGCALGRGDGSGMNRGMAPGASLFDARITLPGSSSGARSVDIFRVLEWLTLNANTVTPPIRVINLSFNDTTESDGIGRSGFLTAQLNLAAQNGIFVAVSAGNHGEAPAPCGIDAIAVAEDVLTVAGLSHEGTVDRADDVVADFSRRGPGIGPVPKPEIAAYAGQCPVGPWTCPPADPVCTGPLSSSIQTTQHNTTNGYVGQAGTSFASPMIAGAAALVIQNNPASTPDAVKQLLMASSDPMGFNADEVGSGLLDLSQIFQGGPPATCDLAITGLSYSPSQVQCFQPVTVTGEVTNLGSTAVTNFTVEFTRWYFGPNNGPALRHPIVAAPVPNTMGPLNPGQTRTFSVTWTPGVDLAGLPISRHSCFFATVHSACDTDASNNETWRNADIIGLNGNSCFAGGPGRDWPYPVNQYPAGVPVVGDPLEIHLRVDGESLTETRNLILELINTDPNLHAELEYLGSLDSQFMDVFFDPKAEPAWVKLRAYYLDPAAAEVAELIVASQELFLGPIGEAEIVIDPGGAPAFRRGDSNGDGQYNIADAVFTLTALFASGPAPGCADAGDSNDDGGYDIADAIYTLSALFTGGPTPPPPGLVCGPDPTDDGLDCSDSPCPDGTDD